MAFRGDEDTDVDTDLHTVAGAPVRYVPLDRVYSTTSPFSSSSAAASGSSAVMSKKVKARKVVLAVESRFCGEDDDGSDGSEGKVASHSGVKRPPIVNVYSRRSKKPRADSRLTRTGLGVSENGGSRKKTKAAKGKVGIVGELAKLGVESEVLSSLDRPRLRDCRNYSSGGKSKDKSSRTRPGSKENGNGEAATKRWVRYILLL